MGRLSDGSNFGDCLSVGQAASYLGVSTATLRNWDRLGKLKPRRHPQNGYRIYLHEDLQAVLRSAELIDQSRSSIAPRIDWSDMQGSDHFVQFYESDDFLVESVTGYVAAALESGNSSIVIATLAHRIAIQRELMKRGVAVSAAIETGRYMVLDAAETLATFMTADAPVAERFMEQIGGIIARLSEGGRRVHAFGEMVSLLWQNDQRLAAARLEEFWNELAKTHRFALFCAYPITAFDETDHGVPFNGICSCHTRVIPAESYSDIDNVDERLRAITRLQQKAQSLEAESAHRAEVQMMLAQRERELNDADRRSNQAFATLARELRSPLASIRNTLELLQTEPVDKTLLKRARELMEREFLQLTRLVDDLARHQPA